MSCFLGVNPLFKNIEKQKGAIILLFAMILPIVLGFIGIAVDVSYLYLEKAKLQNIVDSVALAAAPESDDNRRNTISQYAKKNGIKIESITGLSDIISPKNIGEASIAYGHSPADNEATQVVITKKVPVFFINAITDKYESGIDITVSATAKYNKNSSFVIVAKDGLYINFTNLADSNTNNIEADNWIYGDVYAKQLIRVSYGALGNTDSYQRNLLAVNGHIYTKQLSTDLPTSNINTYKKIFFEERISCKDKHNNIKTGLSAVSDVNSNVIFEVEKIEKLYLDLLNNDKINARIIDIGSKVYTISSEPDTDLVIKGTGTVILRTDNAKYKNIYSEGNIVIEGNSNTFDGIIYSKKNIIVTYSADGKGGDNGNNGVIDKYSQPVSHTFTKNASLFAQNILFGYNYDPAMPDLDKPTNFKTDSSAVVSDDWWNSIYDESILNHEQKEMLVYLKGSIDKEHSTGLFKTSFDNEIKPNIIFFGNGGIAQIPERWPRLKNDSSNKSLAHHYFEKRTGTGYTHLIE